MDSKKYNGVTDVAWEDECVTRCPIRGHMPLCSRKECREQLEKDGREGCRMVLSGGDRD